MVTAFLPFPFNLPYRFPFPFPCPFPTIQHPFGGFHGKVSGENLKISQPHLIHLIISSHRTHAIEIVKGQWLLRNFHVFFSSVSLPWEALPSVTTTVIVSLVRTVYNIARVLALYNSYRTAMNRIFIYARACVNKMT